MQGDQVVEGIYETSVTGQVGPLTRLLMPAAEVSSLGALARDWGC